MFRRFAKMVGRILWSPFWLIYTIRGSMTGASATLLLIAIISLNIVWGYPWLGMFSACVTMFVVGFLLNRLFRPQVDVDYVLPLYVHVGNEFTPTIHLTHRGSLATFDLHVAAEQKRRRFRKVVATNSPITIECSGPPIAMISGGERADTSMTMKSHVRGIHRLPKFQVVSSFPFNLFRWISRIHPKVKIAVAPRPISEDDRNGSRLTTDQLDRWTNRWLAGESFEYAGNRDYVMGMAVRRWDYRSWARLGRPIVREFQTPTLHVANIIVDAALDPSVSRSDADASFELMLRSVATAIENWQKQSINSRIYVTSESIDSFLANNDTGKCDPSLSFVQLAGATNVGGKVSDGRIVEAVEAIRGSRTLVFTTRQLDSVAIQQTGDIHVMRIDLKDHELADSETEGESDDSDRLQEALSTEVSA
ncbi:hypothetical protein Pla22_12730 [Rubripirellula amarantea]|uniref:Uncharacterized protein n=1 Tax=Rubripirellula amarantea TaxID=2527999 RepID=A0A5C5WUH1_9BACT|nr:DUF58 domain-containing protein [Rubripirellula amarantea]TWT53643.1 hypothetical protein Pla22_12730 [Rubripirellula amarantea]